jgi:hypothetical protein
MNNAGVITVDVRDVLASTQNVYDSTSTKVGEVSGFDLNTGWVTIAPNPFSGTHYYVPITLITHIDPNELFVGATRQDLLLKYSAPPTRATSVDGAGEEQTAVTTQPSGYGSGSVVIRQARVNQLRDQIGTDFLVYTADDMSLGRVREYDPATGLMILNRGPFSKHDVVVPITVVDIVDAAVGEIRLVASKADIDTMTPVSLVRTAVAVSSQN